MNAPTKDSQREALTCITLTLLETGKAPTMAQLRDHLGLKSRNSAHTIVLALEAAGEIVVTRFAISLPGVGPTYERALNDGRLLGRVAGREQAREYLGILHGEEGWARDVIYHAKLLRTSDRRPDDDSLHRLIAAIDAPLVNQKST